MNQFPVLPSVIKLNSHFIQNLKQFKKPTFLYNSLLNTNDQCKTIQRYYDIQLTSCLSTIERNMDISIYWELPFLKISLSLYFLCTHPGCKPQNYHPLQSEVILCCKLQYAIRRLVYQANMAEESKMVSFFCIKAILRHLPYQDQKKVDQTIKLLSAPVMLYYSNQSHNIFYSLFLKSFVVLSSSITIVY